MFGLRSSFFFLQALSGLSKQGQVFRNSYVTSHLYHEIATSAEGLGVLHQRHAIFLKTKKTRRPCSSFTPRDQ
jgi:hypothetical protein